MILTLLLSLLASLRVTIIDKYTLPIGVDYLNRIANTGRFENKVQSHSLVFNEMNSNQHRPDFNSPMKTAWASLLCLMIALQDMDEGSYMPPAWKYPCESIPLCQKKPCCFAPHWVSHNTYRRIRYRNFQVPSCSSMYKVVFPQSLSDKSSPPQYSAKEGPTVIRGEISQTPRIDREQTHCADFIISSHHGNSQ